VNAASDLHDVTLRDFVVDGATMFRTSDITTDADVDTNSDNYSSASTTGAVTLHPPATDPNQDRRLRASPMAPSRAGIVFNAERDGEMSNLHFEHLTVRHCTHDGVAIRGATGVAVEACDFSDNGSSVVPGPGLEHNLLLSHVSDCQVIGNRLDDSPWGSGLDVSFGKNLAILDNEVARNTQCGIHVADSSNLRVGENLCEGNDDCGIALVTLMDGCRHAEISGNLAQNNGSSGISLSGVIEGSLKNNLATENGGLREIKVTGCKSIQR
jgi:parallel beta-helix repeat protein